MKIDLLTAICIDMIGLVLLVLIGYGLWAGFMWLRKL